MTSFAFILGVLPLFVSTGADANARYAISTGVIVDLLPIPAFYVIVRCIVGDQRDGAAGMQAVRSNSVDAIAPNSRLTATIAVRVGSLT